MTVNLLLVLVLVMVPAQAMALVLAMVLVMAMVLVPVTMLVLALVTMLALVLVVAMMPVLVMMLVLAMVLALATVATAKTGMARAVKAVARAVTAKALPQGMPLLRRLLLQPIRMALPPLLLLPPTPPPLMPQLATTTPIMERELQVTRIRKVALGRQGVQTTTASPEVPVGGVLDVHLAVTARGLVFKEGTEKRSMSSLFMTR